MMMIQTLRRTARALPGRFKPVTIPRLSITRKFRNKPSFVESFRERVGINQPPPRDWEDLFARLRGNYSSKKLLGTGYSGMTYVFYRVTSKFIKIIEKAARGYVVHGKKSIIPGQSVAVKIIKHVKTHDVFTEFDREIQTMTYLEKKEPVRVGKSTYTASQHVPKLYLGCHMPGFSVIVESFAPGQPLAKYGKVTARTIARVERALLSLWLSGIAHTDLHSSNIMFDHKTKKMTIIDFGRAVVMPPDAVNALRKNLMAFSLDPARRQLLQRPDVMKLISKNVVVQLTNITHHQGGLPKYLDDETMVQYHISRRCLRPECTKELLAKERLTTWVPHM